MSSGRESSLGTQGSTEVEGLWMLPSVVLSASVRLPREGKWMICSRVGHLQSKGHRRTKEEKRVAYKVRLGKGVRPAKD